MFRTCPDFPETSFLKTFTKIYDDQRSVTLKGKILNKDVIEYVTYIVQHVNEKFILSSFQTVFDIFAGFEVIELIVKVRKYV